MESQIKMMKKIMTEYFKDDGISMPEWCEKSALEVYEDIVEYYKALFGVNPTLDDINVYSEKEFRLCPTENIMYQDDYNEDDDECCNCPSCELKREKEEEEESWCERCADCNILMGGKIFYDEEEYDEFPDRMDGYRYIPESTWFCIEHRVDYEDEELVEEEE